MDSGGDTIDSEIGDSADTVAAGKNINQYSYRYSYGREALESQILQMSVDIKLLQDMSTERNLQIKILQGWVILIGIAIFLQTISFALLLVRLWR